MLKTKFSNPRIQFQSCTESGKKKWQLFLSLSAVLQGKKGARSQNKLEREYKEACFPGKEQNNQQNYPLHKSHPFEFNLLPFQG